MTSSPRNCHKVFSFEGVFETFLSSTDSLDLKFSLHAMKSHEGQKIFLNGYWEDFRHFQKIKSYQCEKYRNVTFVERCSVRIVSGELPKTMWKLCLSTKFPRQKIS